METKSNCNFFLKNVPKKKLKLLQNILLVLHNINSCMVFATKHNDYNTADDDNVVANDVVGDNMYAII